MAIARATYNTCIAEIAGKAQPAAGWCLPSQMMRPRHLLHQGQLLVPPCTWPATYATHTRNRSTCPARLPCTALFVSHGPLLVACRPALSCCKESRVSYVAMSAAAALSGHADRLCKCQSVALAASQMHAAVCDQPEQAFAAACCCAIRQASPTAPPAAAAAP